jgi:hypothetical protein
MHGCKKPNEEVERSSDMTGLDKEEASNSDISFPQGELEMRCGK